MKYLLFVYPCDETWDGDEMNSIIAEELSIITKTEIRYLFGKGHSIFHFDSSLSFSEVSDFVYLLKDDVSEFMYFITQSSKNSASNMKEDHFEHLMNVNTKRKSTKKENPIEGFFKKYGDDTFEFNISKQTENITKKVEELVKDEFTDLTIDEILDKIIDQGIDLLTRGEKRKLDDYSKEQ